MKKLLAFWIVLFVGMAVVSAGFRKQAEYWRKQYDAEKAEGASDRRALLTEFSLSTTNPGWICFKFSGKCYRQEDMKTRVSDNSNTITDGKFVYFSDEMAQYLAHCFAEGMTFQQAQDAWMKGATSLRQ